MFRRQVRCRCLIWGSFSHFLLAAAGLVLWIIYLVIDQAALGWAALIVLGVVFPARSARPEAGDILDWARAGDPVLAAQATWSTPQPVNEGSRCARMWVPSSAGQVTVELRLRGDHHLFADGCQRQPRQHFVLAVATDLGGVIERAARSNTLHITSMASSLPTPVGPGVTDLHSAVGVPLTQQRCDSRRVLVENVEFDDQSIADRVDLHQVHLHAIA
jgi:hypothetical protein